jgi:hypothetical protein
MWHFKNFSGGYTPGPPLIGAGEGRGGKRTEGGREVEGTVGEEGKGRKGRGGGRKGGEGKGEGSAPPRQNPGYASVGGTGHWKGRRGPERDSPPRNFFLPTPLISSVL